MLYKIATWNVNSVRARWENIVAWLRLAQPDLLLIQEIKCQNEQFPYEKFSEINYHSVASGQKAYHGVAILSKQPIQLVANQLAGDDDDKQARFLECVTNGVRVINVYVPNGNPIDDPVKFPYKLHWMQRLINHAKTLQQAKLPVIIAGDYNVIPTDADCYNAKNFANDAVAHPLVRALWRDLVAVGFNDALLTVKQDPSQYTYWGYRGRCWSTNHGLRLDHFLVNQVLWPQVKDCFVDRGPRGQDHASDHTPVVLHYAI